MAKSRYINTRFWSDNFVTELNPLDRYLFLYFLTNEHTNICGIYELPLKRMSDETGLEKDMLAKMMKRLKGKVEYIDGWVWIVNFIKHQSKSEKIIIGIENGKSIVPSHILKKIDTLSYDIDKVCIPIQVFESESELESESKHEPKRTAKVAEGTTPNAKMVIDLFGEINPSFAVHFSRRSSRAAAERLFKLHGLEKLNAVIGYIKANIEDRYLPSIASPCQLEDKWTALVQYSARKKSEKNNIIIV